nr:discoidin domain-containing protein [Plastoroseomonas arctica]
MVVEDATLNYPLANLALRRPTQASSVSAEEGIAADAAVNGTKQGLASFRSAVEEGAWWQVDLGRVVGIGRIQLWSAERAPLRGVAFLPVAILASADGAVWETLAALHRPYGGASTQRPAVLEFSQGVNARFLRVQGLGGGCLQFDELEAFRYVPPSRDSAVASVTLSATGPLDGIELRPRHDSGYFSVMSVILAEILHFRRAGLETVSIDDHDIFKKFKDGVRDSVLELVCDRAKWVQADPVGMTRKIPVFGARGRYSPNSMAYKTLDHAAIGYFVSRYFSPSGSVTALQQHWATKYGIDIGKAVVVCYRGTDKVTEIKPASFDDYADQIGRIANNVTSDIVVQTDQRQFLEFVSERFPGRVKFIDDIPMTTGTTVIHNLDLTDEFGLTRRDFGLRLFAMVSWLSQARALLTSSGNVGFWLALLRGHARDVYQFHPHTQALIEPDGIAIPNPPRA